MPAKSKGHERLYLRRVLQRWFAWGSVVALLFWGVPLLVPAAAKALAGVSAVPGWVWWAVAGACLAIAQYQVWKEDRRAHKDELHQLKSERVIPWREAEKLGRCYDQIKLCEQHRRPGREHPESSEALSRFVQTLGRLEELASEAPLPHHDEYAEICQNIRQIRANPDKRPPMYFVANLERSGDMERLASLCDRDRRAEDKTK